LSPTVVHEETLVALQLTCVVVFLFTRDGMAVRMRSGVVEGGGVGGAAVNSLRPPLAMPVATPAKPPFDSAGTKTGA
jgi:hypothetical protein